MFDWRRLAPFILGLLAACADEIPPPAPQPAPETPAPTTWPCQQFGAPDPGPLPTRCALEDTRFGEGTIRLFAVGFRLEPSQLVDYAAFCTAMDERMRRIAPCLASDRPNFVLFPEDVGLPAAFIGPRYAEVRESPDSLAAFAGLLRTNQDAFNHYGKLYPASGTGARVLLSATDVTYRAFAGTFAALAAHYGVHLAASTILPEIEETMDAAPSLRDPSAPQGSPTFVAASGEVHNRVYLWAPSGELVHRFAKAYLTPIEENLLGVSTSPVEALEPWTEPSTGVRLTALLSKDAWMRDLQERMDAWGVELIDQAEAFSGWTIAEHPGDWLPDVFKSSAWSHVQRHANVRASAAPCLTGNLFELVFDGQTHIAVDGRPSDTRRGLVGQAPDVGFAVIGPWAIEDPIVADPSATLEARRAALRAHGEALRPGGSAENEYADAIVATDLDLRPDGNYPAPSTAPAASDYAASRPLVEDAVPRQAPALVARGADVALAVEEGGEGPGRRGVALYLSRDAGVTFTRRFTAAQGRRPAVAITEGKVALVYEAFSDGALDGPIVLVEAPLAGEPTPPRSLSGDHHGWLPVIAPRADGFLVAWTDLRESPRTKLYFSVIDASGIASDPARLDPATTHRLSPRGNQHHVVLAAGPDGTTHAAWLAFPDGSWDLFGASLAPGATAFEPPTRINDFTRETVSGSGVELERLHGEPSLVVLDDGTVVAAWSDLDERRADTDVSFKKRSPGTAWCYVECRPGGDQSLEAFRLLADASRPSLAVIPGGGFYAVWQDGRDGRQDIYARKFTPMGGSEEFRVDDVDGDASKFAPRVAWTGEVPLFAWEDHRTGVAQVRLTGGKVR